jgi:hypothetical protein
MVKKTLLACVALAVALSCYLLDAHKVYPQMRNIFRFIELPCLAYLVYYWIFLRHQLWGSRASLRTRLLKAYFLVVGAIGSAFVIGGLLITTFAIGRVIKESPVDKSGDWTGLWMGIFGIALGIFAIVFSVIFCKRKPK